MKYLFFSLSIIYLFLMIYVLFFEPKTTENLIRFYGTSIIFWITHAAWAILSKIDEKK